MPRIAVFVVLALCARAAEPPARDYVKGHQPEILREFVEFLSIPNIASDRSNIARNVDLLQRMMQRRGLVVRLLQTSGAPPVVYGELNVPGAKRTFVFYAHYDGQPVEPAEWTGGNPFKPALRSNSLEKDGKVLPMPRVGETTEPEWRLYGRATSDDKGAILAMMTALDALADAKKTPAANL